MPLIKSPRPHITTVALCAGLSVGLLFGAPTLANSQKIPLTYVPPVINATLHDQNGDEVGMASLTPSEDGTLVQIDVTLPAGTYALHIHETGVCTPPDFKSAGGHFNPEGKEHGFDNPKGPHAGDLPNIQVPASGHLEQEIYSTNLHLQGKDYQLLDKDGASVMIHAHGDDYKSNPAGDAGPRLACGVLQEAEN